MTFKKWWADNSYKYGQADYGGGYDEIAEAAWNAAISAPPEAVRIREDEARECLAIAKTYSEPFLSPTAEEICNAIERRVMTHLDQTLPTPNKTL